MVLTRKPSVPLAVTMMCACAIVSAAAMLLTFASVASADQHGGGSTAATITAAASVSPSASATAASTSLPTSGGAVFDPTLSVLALLALFALVVSGLAARVLLRRGDAS